MTRSKLTGEEEEEGVGSIPSMANLLMLLSARRNMDLYPSPATERALACKTCARQFPSFQALGGHRASHRKPRFAVEEEEEDKLTKTKNHDEPAVSIREEGMSALDHPAESERKAAACAKRAALLDMNLPRRDQPRSMARNQALAWARVCR